jgi:predicted AAA+ superfamily ATPase
MGELSSGEKIAILDKYNFWDGKAMIFGYIRPSYLNRLQGFLNNSLIKVILGQRRAGKSRIMRMMIEHLTTDLKISPQNCLYINKELHDFNFINDAQALMNAIQLYREIQQPQGKIYLFLDEVQEIEGWEIAVNSLSQDYQVETEIFITGSNANLLSSDLATYLSGRYLTMTVYPFSYEEYLQVVQLPRCKSTVLDYLREGGMPELYQLQGQEAKQNYVQSLLDSIVLRDIVQRNRVRDVFLLEKLIHFTVDSVGSMLSIPSIIKSLQRLGYKSNAETLGNYLAFCQNAFFLHECPRYDLRGKQILIGERKYYLNDLAFKSILQTGFDANVNRMLENLVYLSLRRQGYQVYVGRFNHQEIDFVAEKNNEKLYVQVAYILASDVVVEREFGNLHLIRDNYPKWVVTLDDINFGNRNGVLHKQIWDVL